MLLFVHAFDYMVEQIVTGWCIIATQLFLTDSNRLLVSLLFIAIPTSFLKFEFFIHLVILYPLRDYVQN